MFSSSSSTHSPLSRRVVVIIASMTFFFILLYMWRVAGTAPPIVANGTFNSNSNSNNNNNNNGLPANSDVTPHASERTVYRLAVVTDLDFDSKVDQGLGSSFWKSFYREATLTRDPATGRYSVLFDSEKAQTILRTRLNLDDRGMELSWLASFGGMLYTGDDRAGIVYSVENGRASARFVLGDGDGRAEKGFKSEWAAVKDNLLYVGSFGKEWSNDKGEILNNNPQWVKIIDRHGSITHVDWTRNYEALRKATGFSYPGYLFHEAAAWNPTLQRWVFVPRRASKERYDAEADEVRGTNIIITADASFTDIQMRKIAIDMPADGVQPKGYSEIKFVPGQPNDIVALRTMEFKGTTKSWISVFNTAGVVLMEDVYIDAYKFEGLEFVDRE
jgi:soluble calcium-activated nucleotidase 1